MTRSPEQSERRELSAALNVEIAERVFASVEAHAPCGDGLSRTREFEGPTLADCNAQIREAYPRYLAKGELWPAQYIGPAYSTDDAAALSALAMVGGIIHISRYRDHDDPSAFVWHVGEAGVIPHAPTLALAICRYLLAITEPASGTPSDHSDEPERAS